MFILIFEHSTLDSECNSTRTYWTSRYSSFHQNSSVFKVCSFKPKTQYSSHATPLQQSNQPHHVLLPPHHACCKFRDETTIYASYDVTAQCSPIQNMSFTHPVPSPPPKTKIINQTKKTKTKAKRLTGLGFRVLVDSANMNSSSFLLLLQPLTLRRTHSCILQ